jgi:hypothetical protein
MPLVAARQRHGPWPTSATCCAPATRRSTAIPAEKLPSLVTRILEDLQKPAASAEDFSGTMKRVLTEAQARADELKFADVAEVLDAAERDGKARRGRRRLSRSPEGEHPRERAAPIIVSARRSRGSASGKRGRRGSRRPSRPIAKPCRKEPANACRSNGPEPLFRLGEREIGTAKL